MTDRDRLDPVDLFVFAPIGAVSRLHDDLPGWIEAGRKRVDSEITTARGIGMLAVGQLRRRMSSGATAKSTERPSGRHGSWSASTRSAPADADAVQHGPDTTPVAETTRPVLTGVVAGQLPVEEYDSLSAVQVLPRLASLSSADLDLVEGYEAANRGRRTILHRIEQLRSRL